MYPRVASNQGYSPMPRMGQAQAIPPRPTGTPRGESPGFDDDNVRMPSSYRNGGSMPTMSSNVFQGNLQGFAGPTSWASAGDDDNVRMPSSYRNGGSMRTQPYNVYQGNLEGFGDDMYRSPRTGGGMPPPPSNVFQGNLEGFGDDMRWPPRTGGGFPQPPGRVMDGPGSGYGMPRDPGDTIRRLRPGGPADTSWQPNPEEYQRSIAEERARAAKQDSDLAARRQKKQQQRPEYDVPGFDQPVLDSIVANNEYDRIDRETRQGIANNAASQQGLGSLDGPITKDDERQTIGGPSGRMTVADLKRQRQRASEALRQQELKSQQERAAVDSVMQEFPGISHDIANAILQKRQQQSLADSRARANQELGLNQTPAPQPISGGMGRPALPQVRMPQMPAQSFPIQRFGGSGTYY